MPFVDWLKNLFSKNKTENSEIVEMPSSEIVSTEMMAFPKQNIQELINEEEEFPYWLSNEDALRDEGVIFGLSDTKPEEKLKIIDSIFQKKASGLKQKREELSERIGELNLFMEKQNEEIIAIDQKSKLAIEQEAKEENLLRVAVGLLLSIGMCAGNYFLIDEGLKNSFLESHNWIAWGVFLTGMFSLYNPVAVIHNDAKLTWKRLLEEFGMPLAASIFVFVQVYEAVPLYKSLAFLLFTFFAFMISGKILLGSIARLKYELRALNQNLNIKENKKKVNTDWQAKKDEINSEIEKIRVEKWKILPDLNEIEAQMAKINAEKEAIVNVFMSEYNLAKNYKQKLNSSQIKNIIGE
ncbi:hypothetical protein [Lacihabitans soyangensis]|uniref:Uncharacterized protein n=1 Tax=Lacihabitans soyangensis TaxID=869394 RepID=A0AAE3H1Q2_9BACT|nr:hypothetical protein [Lacihabitans soyangensis]MCP9763322.1 hypothetical protein [Lacihabitans soyangensis]